MNADWSVDAVNREHPALVADVEDLYASLDYIALFAAVLNDRKVARHVALANLDEVLSEVPYVTNEDEDDA